jgi:hypothetical protein
MRQKREGGTVRSAIALPRLLPVRQLAGHFIGALVARDFKTAHHLFFPDGGGLDR